MSKQRNLDAGRLVSSPSFLNEFVGMLDEKRSSRCIWKCSFTNDYSEAVSCIVPVSLFLAISSNNEANPCISQPGNEWI